MHSPNSGHLDAVKHYGKYILSTMGLGLQFSSKPFPRWNPTCIFLYQMMTLPLYLQLLHSTPSVMLIGVHKMPLNLPPPISRMSPSKNLALFEVIFSLWGAALFFGKHTKKLE
jgi:hypothetical protein